MNIPKNKINRYSLSAICLILLVSAAYLAGCKSTVETVPNTEGNQTASQLNQSPTRTPETDQTKKMDEPKKTDEIKGFILTEGIWDDPVIPVCWESMPDGQSIERGWVQDAVENSWDVNSNIDFTGWGLCERHKPGLKGIRIAVIDTSDGASTSGLGKKISGKKNGIELVFRYSHWNEWCANTETSRESCVRSNAVHEFGHGLAFAHEQIRSDTPANCDAEDGGSPGDRELPDAWDANSIMNYCNNDRMRQSGALSASDIWAVREIYGPKSENTD